MNWEWKEIKYNCKILFSLLSLFLSLSDQLLGDLIDNIMRKHDSQKLAIIASMDREKVTSDKSLKV